VPLGADWSFFCSSLSNLPRQCQSGNMQKGPCWANILRKTTQLGPFFSKAPNRSSIPHLELLALARVAAETKPPPVWRELRPRMSMATTPATLPKSGAVSKGYNFAYAWEKVGTRLHAPLSSSSSSFRRDQRSGGSDLRLSCFAFPVAERAAHGAAECRHHRALARRVRAPVPGQSGKTPDLTVTTVIYAIRVTG
jgi:hypothetical protein